MMGFKTDSSEDRQAMSEINVTPLVDVMLVLLIVFIVTAPLITQAVRVDLPKTVKTEAAANDHLAILSILADGGILLNDSVQPLDTLEQKLGDLLKHDSELIVQFQADDAVSYGTVAKAMAIAQKAGIQKLAFVMREQ